MKVLLVTSEINYMPDNYDRLIEGLLQVGSADYKVEAVVSLKTLDKKLLHPLMKMPFAGMWEMASQILKNISREKLLRKRNQLCARFHCSHFKWESMNTSEAINWVRDNHIDLIINLRTRCIYKKKILEAPRLGCINIHHGILPSYRGTFCDLYALSEYRPAGYSIHKMVKKIDDGEVFKVTPVYKRERGERISYQEYLERTIEKEIIDLNSLLNEISLGGKLPKPLEFSEESTDIVYTKNPNYKKIRSLIKEGITL